MTVPAKFWRELPHEAFLLLVMINDRGCIVSTFLQRFTRVYALFHNFAMF